MFRLLTSLFLFVLSFPIYLFSQPLAAVSWSAYEGFMGEERPVRVLLQRDEKSVRGLILDLDRLQLMPMEGSWNEDELSLTAGLLREEPALEDGMLGFVSEKHTRAGEFKAFRNPDGTLAGEWTAISRMAQIPGSTEFSLQERDIPFADSPFALRRLLKRAGLSQAEFQFALAEQLLGVDFEALYYFNDQGEARQLGAEEMRADILDRNLMGDPSEESLMILNFGHGMYILAPFAGPQKQTLGYHLLIKKPEPLAQPCRTEAPGQGYFFFEFKEVFQPNEYVLLGRTYGGQCSGVARSDDIRFYLWRFEPDEVRTLYRDIETQWVYESPDPEAVQPAISNSFSLTEGARSAFPKRLKKEELPVSPAARKDAAQAKPKVTFIELE